MLDVGCYMKALEVLPSPPRAPDFLEEGAQWLPALQSGACPLSMPGADPDPPACPLRPLLGTIRGTILTPHPGHLQPDLS